MKAFILALCIAVASAGIVQHIRCGGFGTLTQLRVDNCEGPICKMQTGIPYAIEGDLITSTSSPSLTVKVTALYHGFLIPMGEMVLPNSSVQQGQLFVIKLTVTPSDLMSGSMQMNVECSRTGDRDYIETCFGMIARIL